MDTEQLHATTSTASMIPHLVFKLDGSEYAIHVKHVREIITSVNPSTVPGAPDYLMGVINLRGKILPMVDMRKRFDLPVLEDDGRDCFIVLTLEHDNQCYELGIRVDAVCEVQRIPESCIDSISDLSNYSSQRLSFQGVAKTASGIKMIVDSTQLVEQLRSDVRLKLQSSAPSNPQPSIEELCLS